jgi:hypothetical protein
MRLPNVSMRWQSLTRLRGFSKVTLKEDSDRKDEIFQAWVIQKIAGIQISTLELVERINALLKTSHFH